MRYNKKNVNFDLSLFQSIILEISKCDVVMEEVRKNFFNNKWWPLEIKDYRKRMIIAGLSSRVSYSMIETYNKVCKEIDKFTFEEIGSMNEKILLDIIKPIGLGNMRIRFINSMIKFLSSRSKNYILNSDIQIIIEEINKNVYGASYKVAQCALLYAKGYFCGIFPIDSGMKDVFFPCIGFDKYSTNKGHEILREKITYLISNLDIEFIQRLKSNHKDFFSSDDSIKYILIWWIHLIMIYFKRFYCNKKKASCCPLSGICKINKMCLNR